MIMADDHIATSAFGPDGRKQCGRIDFEAVRRVFRNIFGRFRAFDTVFSAEQ